MRSNYANRTTALVIDSNKGGHTPTLRTNYKAVSSNYVRRRALVYGHHMPSLKTDSSVKLWLLYSKMSFPTGREMVLCELFHKLYISIYLQTWLSI